MDRSSSHFDFAAKNLQKLRRGSMMKRSELLLKQRRLRDAAEARRSRDEEKLKEIESKAGMKAVTYRHLIIFEDKTSTYKLVDATPRFQSMAGEKWDLTYRSTARYVEGFDGCIFMYMKFAERE